MVCFGNVTGIGVFLLEVIGVLAIVFLQIIRVIVKKTAKKKIKFKSSLLEFAVVYILSGIAGYIASIPFGIETVKCYCSCNDMHIVIPIWVICLFGYYIIKPIIKKFKK